MSFCGRSGVQGNQGNVLFTRWVFAHVRCQVRQRKYRAHRVCDSLNFGTLKMSGLAEFRCEIPRATFLRGIIITTRIVKHVTAACQLFSSYCAKWRILIRKVSRKQQCARFLHFLRCYHRSGLNMPTIVQSYANHNYHQHHNNYYNMCPLQDKKTLPTIFNYNYRFLASVECILCLWIRNFIMQPNSRLSWTQFAIFWHLKRLCDVCMYVYRRAEQTRWHIAPYETAVMNIVPWIIN